MAKVNGGWLTAKTLYDFGIRNIFSLGGGHINPIYFASECFNEFRRP